MTLLAVSAGEPALALGQLLDRLAEEAEALARTTARAEAALQAVLERLAVLPPGLGSDLQQIDLVRQSLEDFGRVLWIAAAAVPPDRELRLPALRAAVTLTGLASRLVGTPPPAAGAGDDLLLF